MNIKMQVVLLSSLIIIISLYIGYKIGQDGVPKNCAELGAAYLKIGRETLSITDFGSKQWSQLINDETTLTNLCYKSIGK